MKRCSKCGGDFPETSEYFRVVKNSKNGFRGICKSCEAERNKRWRENNPEYKKLWYVDNPEYNKQYYKANKETIIEHVNQWGKNNPESVAKSKSKWRENNPGYDKLYCEANRGVITERKKLYYEANRETIAERHKLYYETNKEAIAENNREAHAAAHKKWCRAHPDKVNANNQRRRLRERRLPSTLTVSQWEAIKDIFNNRCCYCGSEKSLTQEHFVGVSQGGEHTHNNILPACQSCNSSKGTKDFFEWYPTFKYYSEKREQKILEFLNYKNDIQQLSIL